MLKLLNRAIGEMDAHMRTNYYEQMATILRTRKPDTYGRVRIRPQETDDNGNQDPQVQEEAMKAFIYRCIRRQVELAMFLPIRRDVFKLIFPFIALQALNMQKALEVLQSATTSFFGIPDNIEQTQAFPRAVKAFKEVINAYIPSDQGQLLLRTANAVMELYSECKRLNAQTPTPPRTAVTQGPKAQESGRDSISSTATTTISSSVVSSGVTEPDSVSRSGTSLSGKTVTEDRLGDGQEGERDMSMVPSNPQFDAFSAEAEELASSVVSWQKSAQDAIPCA